ncbi:sigma-24 [Phycisphaerae bacterium]|nr:sigma-24 [Phycisphaerae bacterium]
MATQPSNFAPGPDDSGDADARDLAIVERIRSGDAAAWSALIRDYQDRLFGVCFRMVRDREMAADLTQDAFVKVIRGIDSFDGRSKLSTWMIRVTMNVCLSKLRSEKLRRHASLDGLAAGSSGDGRGGDWEDLVAQESRSGREPAGTANVELKEERERVLAALRELDPEQRAILILCDCRSLPYEEIAQVLGVAVGTVKSRVFRARTALRDVVEQMARASAPRMQDGMQDEAK